jgi:hypothetical protein
MKNEIFRLKTEIFSLKSEIFRLKTEIFSLKTEIFSGKEASKFNLTVNFKHKSLYLLTKKCGPGIQILEFKAPGTFFLS